MVNGSPYLSPRPNNMKCHSAVEISLNVCLNLTMLQTKKSNFLAALVNYLTFSRLKMLSEIRIVLGVLQAEQRSMI